MIMVSLADSSITAGEWLVKTVLLFLLIITITNEDMVDLVRFLYYTN